MTGQDDWDKLSGQEQSNVQVGVTDMTSRVSELMHDAFGFGRMRAPEQSNFEGHDLNDMIDIVENTNPSDLESAGEALWKAQKAISDAATELRGHLTAAEDDWKGEAGKAFQIWGKGLAGHADALADYAKAAGVQITSAGTGLASVRSAMPPRDSRLVRKSVADIPVVARVETNDEYTAATKVEGHRQEAINQMNRLSSFYVVSEQSLKGLEPPTFEAMPNVGVPKPTGGAWSSLPNEPHSGTFQHHASSTESTAEQRHTTVTPHANIGLQPVKDVPDSTSHPLPDVGTTIDSVDTLPQQTPTTPVTSTTTPTTTPTTGPQGVPLLPTPRVFRIPWARVLWDGRSVRPACRGILRRHRDEPEPPELRRPAAWARAGRIRWGARTGPVSRVSRVACRAAVRPPELPEARPSRQARRPVVRAWGRGARAGVTVAS